MIGIDLKSVFKNKKKETTHIETKKVQTITNYKTLDNSNMNINENIIQENKGNNSKILNEKEKFSIPTQQNRVFKSPLIQRRDYLNEGLNTRQIRLKILSPYTNHGSCNKNIKSDNVKTVSIDKRQSSKKNENDFEKEKENERKEYAQKTKSRSGAGDSNMIFNNKSNHSNNYSQVGYKIYKKNSMSIQKSKYDICSQSINQSYTLNNLSKGKEYACNDTFTLPNMIINNESERKPTQLFISYEASLSFNPISFPSINEMISIINLQKEYIQSQNRIYNEEISKLNKEIKESKAKEIFYLKENNGLKERMIKVVSCIFKYNHILDESCSSIKEIKNVEVLINKVVSENNLYRKILSAYYFHDNQLRKDGDIGK